MGRSLVVQYRGIYDLLVPYRPGDIVIHNGSTWVAVKASQGVPPSTSSEYWQQWGSEGSSSSDDILLWVGV